MGPSITTTIKLPNATTPGATIPAIGLGTWQSPAEQVTDAVAYALSEAGYLHIDCALAYENEKAVKEGLKKSGVKREDIFITSKVWSTYLERVEECVDKILENLGIDYIDLLLIHWPIALNPNGNHPLFPTTPDGKFDIDHNHDLSKTWKAFEDVQKKGKTKHIGVSNFSEYTLLKILPTATIKPAVNQIELHPYLPQWKLLKYLESEGIVPQAYSPLGSTNSPILKDDVIVELAQKYGAEPAQIVIGWFGRSQSHFVPSFTKSMAKNIIVLPKSVTPSRILTNSKPANLSAEDIAKIDALSDNPEKAKRFIKPPWGVKVGFEDWDLA
ncbi:Aldo/keto reductase [Cantharellus anzutake]|uniref:Aldo/keto reductase n=1 Tax=Cantharellus anzutake TaxID=1750568 RepID=UPI001907901B|nr:Aldo/keto reductase [Cantharellus anzutake]KAF8324867.1 Aldo/keto reductase [Cantharellus anzutake]